MCQPLEVWEKESEVLWTTIWSKWKCLVQGVVDGPAVFQNFQNDLLEDLGKAYIDESFFGGNSLQEALLKRDKADSLWKEKGFKQKREVLAQEFRL